MFKTSLLRFLFVLALIWAMLIVFAEEVERFFRWLPAIEGSSVHYLFEIMAILLFLAGVTWLSRWLFKRLPNFLRIPKTTSNLIIAISLIIYIPLVFGLLAITIFSFWWVVVVSGEDPTHSQYGLSAWFAALFYGIALTPMTVIVWVWSVLK